MGSKSGGSSMQQPMPSQGQQGQQQQFSQGPSQQATAAYNQAQSQNYNPSLNPFQSAQQYSSLYPMNMPFLNAARQNGYTPPNNFQQDMNALNAARAAHINPAAPQISAPAVQPPAAPPPIPTSPMPMPFQRPLNYSIAPGANPNRPYTSSTPPAPPQNPIPQDPRFLDSYRSMHYNPLQSFANEDQFKEQFHAPGQAFNPQFAALNQAFSPQFSPENFNYQDYGNFMPRFYSHGGHVGDDDVGDALSLADRLLMQKYIRG